MTPAPHPIVDSHCHLDFPDFETELPEVIARARAAGVTRMVTICTRLKNEPRVRAIADRLIRQVPAFRGDAVRWHWEINVLSSSEVNAWCMPGGKIAVYTGLIEKLNITDDELAAVMGHEIAHALREHSRERASEQVVANVGITILATVAGVGTVGQKGMEYAYQGLLGLPNSRAHETEADRMGVELAARAGYDPRAAITLWEKMGEVGGKEPPKFMSTHPSRSDRVRDLTVYSERVMPLYKEARAR